MIKLFELALHYTLNQQLKNSKAYIKRTVFLLIQVPLSHNFHLI